MSVTMVPQPWNIPNADVQVMQVIVTQIKSRGDGTDDNPHRVITQFWDMEGNLIADFDPTPKDTPKWDMTITATPPKTTNIGGE